MAGGERRLPPRSRPAPRRGCPPGPCSSTASAGRSRGVDRSGRAAATLFVDLDRFKSVNDRFGHATGDELLQEIARRLERTVRAMDTVSRLGGDEFLVLCEQVDHQDEALQIAKRIQAALSATVQVGVREVSIGCSIGIAIQEAGRPPRSAAQLVQDGDRAMYSVKRQGRGGIQMVSSHELSMRASTACTTS